MIIDFKELKGSQIYHTMIQTIIPRPIAWVLSESGDILNLAPFSFFMGISSSPPLLVFSVGQKGTEGRKDTWENIQENKRFVLHIPSRGQEVAVTATAEMLPREKSELDLTKLETIPFEGFPLPRLKDCKIAYGCYLDRIIEIGDAPQGLIVGRIETVYIEDSCVTERKDGRLSIDPKKIDPIARLGGNDYGFLGDLITVPRPDH